MPPVHGCAGRANIVEDLACIRERPGSSASFTRLGSGRWTPSASLLDGPRARGAFLLRVELDPPWAMRIEDEAPLSLVAVTRGAAWVGAARRDAASGAAGRRR